MNRVAFKPRPHQQLAIEFLLGSQRRINLWAMMGMGKTVSALMQLVVARELLGDDAPTLVIAPKRVAEVTWPSEVAKWEQFKGLDVAAIVGNKVDRLAAVKADRAIHTVNYDNIPWLVEYWGHRWPYRRVIADESTKLKSYRTRGGGRRAQELARVAHRYVREWVNMTGTPSPNGLIDLWGQQWFIDKGRRLGETFSAFRDRWFTFNQYSHRYTPLPHAEKEITELLSDCTLPLRVEDWFDLDKPVVSTIEVELPQKARKLYDQMERQFVTSVDGHHVEAQIALARSAKCLQIASGTVLTNDLETGRPTGEVVDVHDAKLEALESLLGEMGGENVMVAYHWRGDLAKIKRAFPHAVALAEETDTKAVIERWNRGEIPLLLVHAQSAGHGLNLQYGGRTLVFYSFDWKLEEHDQVIERIGPMRQHQAGLDRAVLIYYLVAKNTLDEDVLLRLRDKADVQTSLSSAIASAKRRA